MLLGLSLGGDTGLEFSWGGGDHEDGDVGLGGAGDHVLDEVSVSWGVDDGDVELLGLELVEGDVDGDTSGSLGLEFIEDPGVGEGSLALRLGLLLVLLEGSLVEASALDDEVTSGGGLSGVDVTDDNDVNLSFLIRHL